MNNDLIKRYVYAATKNLPNKVRGDVAQELESLIDDMLSDRCGDVLPTDKDVRVVLTELGTPREIGQKYSPDKGKSLIGEGYYSIYKLVLKIVLLCVAFGVTVAAGIGAITEQSPWYFVLPGWIGSLVGSVVCAFGFVTLLFAIFERKGIVLEDEGDFLSHLPPVPEKKYTISKGDAIGGIVLCLVFVFVFLVVPQVIVAGISSEDGMQIIPIFSEAATRGSWMIVVAFALLGIGRESFKLIEGRYTKRLFVVSVVVDILTAVLTVIWVTGVPQFLNPDFVGMLDTLFTGDTIVIRMFQNFHLFFGGIILFALALDTLVTGIKTWQAKE